MGGALSRRDFGKALGLAGAGVAAPALLAGCSSGSARSARAAAANGAANTWQVTGKALASLGAFDTTMKGFMQSRDITCGQLAVVRNGKLVLSRGYTWNVSTAPVTQPTSLFRIASVSKPITATAVLRLVQDGKLKLTDRPATLLGLSTAADPRLEDVTVLRLLQHLGGWDREISPDPVFADWVISQGYGKPLPISQADIMRYASAQKLDHAPGSTYAYANYGYTLLGQIIEKITGQEYADYVQRTVLAPLDIQRMRLGASRASGTGEVEYDSDRIVTTILDSSGKKVPAPYGLFNLENLDSAAGWTATAMDLTRFVGVYEGGTSVLNTASIERALAEPETGVSADGWYYGCGWQVRSYSGGRMNIWHSGSLAGTYSMLVRRTGGLTWAVLFNQRPEDDAPDYDIDTRLLETSKTVQTWPTGDLTSTYF
ncbi:serine hydrolase domain-containing protein [Actinomadura sp. B10D3]|uniref:serine hydrolase domain-containing protein n=1 Tax=Actinomadura sp. B10D3 TaxID=3153557 RepID=UPI00325F567F